MDKPSLHQTTIEQLIEGLYDGPHATPPVADDGAIFLGIDNLTNDGRIDLSRVRRISENDLPAWTKRVTPRAGDLVFSYEATLHRYALIPEGFRGCLGRRMALLRLRADRVDGRYLLYHFFGRQWRETVEANILTGATVNRVPISRFPKFPITLPINLAIQRRIASVLSAYDDLIENNQRRVGILEEMARALYREWFVDFRFPGAAPLSRSSSENCRRPENWSKRPAGEMAQYVNGFAFKPEDWAGEGLPIIKIKELKAGIEKDSPRYSGELPEKYRVRDGDLLFSWSADLNVYIWNGGEGWLNQHLFVVRPNEGIPTSFLYFALDAAMPTFRAMSNGATMKHIKRSALDQVELCVAEPAIRARFDEIVSPMLKQVIALWKQTRLLRATRDLLLPRLISGELDVSRVPDPAAL